MTRLSLHKLHNAVAQHSFLRSVIAQLASQQSFALHQSFVKILDFALCSQLVLGCIAVCMWLQPQCRKLIPAFHTVGLTCILVYSLYTGCV